MPKMVNIRALLGLRAFFWTLPCLLWVLLGLTGPFLGLREPYLGLNQPYVGLTWPYWALLGLTGPYWTLLGLTLPTGPHHLRHITRLGGNSGVIFRPKGLQWPKTTIFGQKPHPMAQNHHLHLGLTGSHQLQFV